MRYLLLLLLVTLLVIAGCDQNDSIPSTPQVYEEVVDQPSDIIDDTVAPIEQPETDDSLTIIPPAGNDLAEQLGVKLDAHQSQQFTVEYDMESVVMGSVNSGTLTQYFGSINQIRLDIMMEGMESRAYFIDGTVSICTDAMGYWMCFEGDSAENVAEIDPEIRDNLHEYTITQLPSRTLAGVTASCYEIISVQGAQLVYCFSPEDIPLLISSFDEQNGHSNELVASSYQMSVPSGVFELPAQPEGFPDYGTWMT